MITEEAKKFYFLLKKKVQKLNSDGLNFKREIRLSDGNMKIHLEGEKKVDFLVGLPKSPTDPLVLIKDGERYPYLSEDLVNEMIFAAEGVHVKKYLPNMNPAIIPT